MPRRITVSDKLLRKIEGIIGEALCLSNVTEFEELEHEKLFEDGPEFWSDIENAISEYSQARATEIMEGIERLLR